MDIMLEIAGRCQSKQMPGMVTMIMAQAQRYVMARENPLSIRLETYDASDRVERAEPSPPMDPRSQIRNRGVGPKNPLADENNRPVTAQSSPSGDSPQQEGIQGMEAANSNHLARGLEINEHRRIGNRVVRTNCSSYYQQRISSRHIPRAVGGTGTTVQP